VHKHHPYNHSNQFYHHYSKQHHSHYGDHNINDGHDTHHYNYLYQHINHRNCHNYNHSYFKHYQHNSELNDNICDRYQYGVRSMPCILSAEPWILSQNERPQPNECSAPL
jgi:hypothetical protein